MLFSSNVLLQRNRYLNRNARKRTVVHVCPAKIQISLRIRAVWSESSLGAFWIAKYANILQAASEDSIQTAQMRRLNCVFVGRTCQKVRFLTLRLIIIFPIPGSCDISVLACRISWQRSIRIYVLSKFLQIECLVCLKRCSSLPQMTSLYLLYDYF